MKERSKPIRRRVPRVVVTVLSALACAGAAVAGPAPQIRFEESRHDFGRLLAGEVARHEFRFTNAGDADLILENVIPSCGCTTLKQWTRVVPPGGQGVIPLEFNSIGMLGEVSKTVAIQSNDPVQPGTVVTLEGVIWSYVEVHPRIALIKVPARAEGPQSATLQVINRTGGPLKLQAPACTVPQIRTRLREVKAGEEFELVVETVPPLPPGDLQGTIRIPTSSVEAPVIEVPVTVVELPEIVVSPDHMFLPTVPPDFPEPYVKPITLSDPACDAPDAKLEIREVKPGRLFDLAVTFSKDFGYDPAQPDRVFSITARTSLPSQPEIRVGVQFAKPPPAPPEH
jgi:hypothetical protein